MIFIYLFILFNLVMFFNITIFCLFLIVPLIISLKTHVLQDYGFSCYRNIPNPFTHWLSCFYFEVREGGGGKPIFY